MHSLLLCSEYKQSTTYTCKYETLNMSWLPLFYFLVEDCVVNIYIIYLENPAQCETYPENVCPGAGKRTDGKPLFMEALSPVFVGCIAICKRHFQKWSDKPGQCKVCRRNCSRDSICTRVHCYMDCNPKGPVFLCVNPCFHLFHTRH